MYLIVSRSFHPRNGEEDKADARICAKAPAGLFITVEDRDCGAIRYVAHYAEGDDAQAFNACWDALKAYGMTLDPEGRVYPTGGFDVTGFQAFLPQFLAEQERRGIVTPEVV